jgi:two-component system chemotaxis response regulator CheB
MGDMVDYNSDKQIKVLVVDDSALMRKQICSILETDPEIKVVGDAKDGEDALEQLAGVKPDVVTLDVEMPRMNGITALKHIMMKHAVPTVMISALTSEGSKTTFDALRYGAVEVVSKPSRRDTDSLEAQRKDIISKVKRAALIRTGRLKYVRVAGEEAAQRGNDLAPADNDTAVVGLAAGTGGYYSLLRIIPALAPTFTGVVISVMNVRSRYVEPFVTYLQAHSRAPVQVVKGIAAPRQSSCYVCAAEDLPVIEKANDGSLRLRLEGPSDQPVSPGPLDRFLMSLSFALVEKSVGILLTGAGKDGSEGLASVREAGGITAVQDINNCADPSMPLAALQKGTVDKVIPDYEMAEFIMSV